MRFEHRDEKVYASKKDETPSMFFARIIRDLERKGANIWGYLQDEMKGTEVEVQKCPHICPDCGATCEYHTTNDFGKLVHNHNQCSDGHGRGIVDDPQPPKEG
jgi:hypothetical protein